MEGNDDVPIDLQRETAALRRVARGILYEPALAEDAVQEAWLAALRSQQGTRPDGGRLNEGELRLRDTLDRSVMMLRS